MDKTKLILGMSKELNDLEISKRTRDLRKINKFLIRETFKHQEFENTDNFEILRTKSFLQFLNEVGMFEEEKAQYSQQEIKAATQRYYNALSASIEGTGAVLIKREVKDLFTNGYNKNIRRLHQSNHDFQVVIDQ